jgi:acetyl-CoA acetyltransferase
VQDAFILGGVCTPGGKYGRAQSHIRTPLGMTMVAACEKAGVPLQRVDDIVAGWVNFAHDDVGEHRPLGWPGRRFPDSVRAVTVNRFCASSLTGAIQTAHAIRQRGAVRRSRLRPGDIDAGDGGT